MALLGLETEYAIRFTPAVLSARPGNDVIYQAVSSAIGALVQTQPGARHGTEVERVFTESGASFSYESLPTSYDGGLVEGATPECSNPSQLLLYQKANDALLVEAIPTALERLRAQGFEGELAFLKNCRDAEGHVYGAQENYETQVARGAVLALYRAGLIAALPFIALSAVAASIYWVLVVVIGIPTMLVLALLMIVRPESKWLAKVAWAVEHKAEVMRVAVRWLGPIERVITYPAWFMGRLPLQHLAFRRQRAASLAFLVSRPAWSGAGTLGADGSFGLSEKGPSMNAVVRSRPGSTERSIFDTGNLLKDVLGAVHFRVGAYFGLLRPRQRMQLGLSDSNMAETAEYLKVATTSLVIEMAEAGHLDQAPRLVHPIEALHALVGDPTLRTRVEVHGREPMTALELQRAYLAAARSWLRERVAAPMEAHRAVTLWADTLDGLEADPGRLVGTLDWPSKRYLIEASAAGEPFAVQKKIDLKYHELDTGYFADMLRRGIAPRLVSEDEARTAQRTPPSSGPARMRGQLVKTLQGSPLPVQVSWESVRIGGRLRGKVIQLRPRKR
jgi:proteasome accessory factor A